MQGLAVAVTGLQAVTTIQAHWFNRNQALPAALTTPPSASAAAGAGADAGAGAASAASAGAVELSPAVSSSGVGHYQ